MLRIAMWSGPRNLSTALMRAWENRGDTAVWDEPFYACYLSATGADHPAAAEVIAAGESDWRRVVEGLTGAVPGNRAVFFQKHMTHHLLPGIDRGWMDEVENCFLIRDPREGIASYARIRQAEVWSGQFISPAHVLNRSEVVVLGSQVAADLYGARDPVGTTVRLNDREFTIVGVLAE
ncbi:MAG: ABC transporter permease, partial [Rhodospirillales bacterium]|nr:ABC transporter permease [Rhodospirillales bacterium]